MQNKEKNKNVLTLTLPSDPSYLSLARSYIREVARKTGLSEKDTDEIVLAATEAITNVMRHAFLPEEKATFHIICEVSSLGLKVIVKDKGYPFSPEKIEKYSIDEVMQGKKPSGLGFFLMQQSVDEFTFHNMGFGGKEIHLVKYVHQKHIEDYLKESELKPYQRDTAPPQSPAKKITYRVDLLDAKKAIEISQCAYRTYGYSYIHEFIYYPARIAEMNNRGQLVSAVAVNEDTDEIMSHAALEIKQDKDLVELGAAFTKPEFRHQGCFNRICEYLMDVAGREKIKGVYATAVTIHPFSQKAILKNNFKECGILIGMCPASIFKHSLEHGTQRESLVIFFRPIDQSVTQPLYAPAHHKEIVQEIYTNIAVSVQWQEPQHIDKLELGAKQARIEVKVRRHMSEADVYVNEYGPNIIKEVQHRLNELFRRKIVVVYLHLDLCDPLTASFIEKFEELGFFFSGVLPSGKRQDFILQYLSTEINYDKIQVASEFGAKLLSYIKKQNLSLSIT